MLDRSVEWAWCRHCRRIWPRSALRPVLNGGAVRLYCADWQCDGAAIAGTDTQAAGQETGDLQFFTTAPGAAPELVSGRRVQILRPEDVRW